MKTPFVIITILLLSTLFPTVGYYLDWKAKNKKRKAKEEAGA